MAKAYMHRRRIKKIIIKRFMKRLGYPLNLRNPQTYCEKIQWLKCNQQHSDEKVISRADKYTVREFIKSKGFANHLVELYGCWDKPEEIDWEILPNRFVFKLNNGCGSKYLWFVQNKDEFPRENFVSEVKESMSVNYGFFKGEFHYSKMPTKIIAEAYLGEEGNAIRDYKFYCFHGEIAFFSVEEGKIDATHVRDYYNIDWTVSKVKFFGDIPRPSQAFEKPAEFDQMILMAQNLSQGYPHIRVDMYNVDGQIYFGELTYTPENGMTRWDPLSLDLEYGQLMILRDINH
ncbi:MAG: hypothetical protein HRT89_16925 [Lentisphaeria bacterium]|nr:hypothetical protein [Lentisphaeria bacterium]NQZ69744.1 hypothetical protein [Lentisphaeria bacterium]